MTSFRVAYIVRPPRTVIHVLGCPKTQQADFILKVEAETALDAQRELKNEYASSGAADVAILLCDCVFAGDPSRDLEHSPRAALGQR